MKIALRYLEASRFGIIYLYGNIFLGEHRKRLRV